MRKVAFALVLLVLANFVFADMVSSLVSIPGTVYGHSVLIVQVLVFLALVSSLHYKNRQLTLRFLIASFILLFLSAISCAFFGGNLPYFSMGSWPTDCKGVDCQKVCLQNELNRAQAAKTDALFHIEWISLLCLAVCIFGFSYDYEKSAGRRVMEIILQIIVVVVLLLSVLFIEFVLMLVGRSFLPLSLISTIDWPFAALVIAGIVFMTNDEKKPLLKKDKYFIASVIALLIAFAGLVYMIYSSSSPGFVFTCHELIRFSIPDFSCCSCP